MATKKITELSALVSGSLASATDVLAIVDTTANTTNKITVTNLVHGSAEDNGVRFGALGAQEIISKTAVSATIAVTKDTDYAVPAIEQPAGTFLKDVIFLNAGNIVTAGASGDDLDFEIGTAASGGQIVALTALLDDGGSAVTWTANTPLFVVRDGMGLAANQFATTGVGPKGGPATTEAIVLAGATYSSAARDLHVNFRANTHNLATAATTVRVIMNFMKVYA
jgi:hypothetical protein